MANWFTSLFSSRKRWEDSMDEELRFHLERQTSANMAAGMTPEEARRQARLQLGAEEGLKESCREERRGYWFDCFWPTFATACAAFATTLGSRPSRCFRWRWGSART